MKYPPEERLSWFVYTLPGLDQKRQDVVGLLTQINYQESWLSAPNRQAARTRLLVAICPLNPPQMPADQPALTCYVGIAGVGSDAALLTLPPLPDRAPARAGAFRYDAATPFDRIGDGLSQTLLMGETANDLGPWLRGGPSTVRGVEDGKDAKPFIGADGQFGGYFPTGTNFATVRRLCPGAHAADFTRCVSTVGDHRRGGWNDDTGLRLAHPHAVAKAHRVCPPLSLLPVRLVAIRARLLLERYRQAHGGGSSGTQRGIQIHLGNRICRATVVAECAGYRRRFGPRHQS